MTIEEAPTELPTKRAYVEIQIFRLIQATGPSVGFDNDVTNYAQHIQVDTDAISRTLTQYGQSQAMARSLHVRFVSETTMDTWFRKRAPGGIRVAGFHEPLKGRTRLFTNGELTGYTQYRNYICLALGEQALTEEGVARLNRTARHEIGHCATRTIPIEPSLYERGKDGTILPYRDKHVFGIVPVKLAVALLQARGYSEMETLWLLGKKERRARSFERRFSTLNPISLRT